MTRVVYLGHTARLSGAELALVRLLPALADVDAHVILAEAGPLVEELGRAGATVEVLPMDESARGVAKDAVTARSLRARAALGSAAYVARVAGRLRSLAPDLVHTNSLKAGVYGSAAGRIARVPTVWQVHDRIAPDYLPAPAVRLVRGLLATMPAAVVANSRTTAATLGRTPEHQVRRVVAPAVAPLTRHPVPEHPFRVGILGRLAPWKGHEVFLRAFAAAFPDGTEEAAVIGGALFGEQDHEAMLRTLAADLGIGARVEFRGFRHDVADELSRIDALVHASTLPEPFGQVIVEGMAAALPVIASAAGGPTEIVHDGVDGLLVPPGDVASLAARLAEVRADPALRARLGAAGPPTAARYRPEVVGPQMRAVYDEVLVRRRATREPSRA